jgi:hypothetical protein
VALREQLEVTARAQHFGRNPGGGIPAKVIVSAQKGVHLLLILFRLEGTCGVN